MTKILKFYCLIIIFIFLCGPIATNAVKKPIIKSGIKNYVFFADYSRNEPFYTEKLRDSIYFMIKEELNDLFYFQYEQNYYFDKYQNLNNQLKNLYAHYLSHSLLLGFYMNDHHKITLKTTPVIKYYQQIISYRVNNKLEYRFNIKGFIFNTRYSHQLKNDSHFINHSLMIGLYWYLPSYRFLRFKAIFYSYFEQSYYSLQKLSYLKKSLLHLEISIDFNKIDVEEIFNHNNENNELSF